MIMLKLPMQIDNYLYNDIFGVSASLAVIKIITD